MDAIDQKFRDTVARNVRRYRKRRNWTQENLREAGSWNYQSMVSLIETGKVGIGTKTLKKLSKALCVPISELTQEVEDEVIPEFVRIRTVMQQATKKPEGAHVGIPDVSLSKQKVYGLSGILQAIDSNPPGSRLYLPDWLPGRNFPKLLCVVVDRPEISGGFKKGDILCIDREAVPYYNGPEEKGFYLLKTPKSGVLIRYGETEKGTLYLYDTKESEKNSFSISLEHYSPHVIGKVVWSLRYAD